MLYSNASDVSRGTDVNMTSSCKEYIICHYWTFLNKGFMFLPTICNGCHDVYR